MTAFVAVVLIQYPSSVVELRFGTYLSTFASIWHPHTLMSWILRFVFSHIQSIVSCNFAWCSILYISVAASVNWHHRFVGSPESIFVLRSIFSIVRIYLSAFPFSREDYVSVICRPHWNSLLIMSLNSLDFANSPPWSVLIFVTVLFFSSSWRRKILLNLMVIVCLWLHCQMILLILPILNNEIVF